MYKTHKLNRDKVETLLKRHSKSFAELARKKKKGLIDDNSMLYELEDVIPIAYAIFVGAWANCQGQVNPKSHHSDRQGTALGKRFIKMAFVKGKK